MMKTWGYYQIEIRFREYYSWPARDNLSGYGGIILLFINFSCSCYPMFKEILDINTKFRDNLFNLQYLFIQIMLLSGCAQLIFRRHALFKMIGLVSELKCYGCPERQKRLDSLARPILKICRYTGVLINFLLWWDAMFNYPKLGSNQIGILDYYIPFKLPPWQRHPISLFQIYSCSAIINLCMYAVMMYCYTLELLVIHIENLISIIDEIRFVPYEKICLKFQYVMSYHLDLFRAFLFASRFLRNLVVPQRFLGAMCIIISSTAFLMRKDMSCIVICSGCFSCIFICHWAGQRITNAGADLTNAIYNLNWYEADIKIQKNIMTFLIISQRALTIQTPFFGLMSFTALAKECQLIFVWFNWVRKF